MQGLAASMDGFSGSWHGTSDALMGMLGGDALVASAGGAVVHQPLDPAFGAGGAAGVERAMEGDVTEHPLLQPFVDAHAQRKLSVCVPGRCKHMDCLLRAVATHHDWVVGCLEEGGRLQRACRAQDLVNTDRKHGGGKKTGAQDKATRDAARIKSTLLSHDAKGPTEVGSRTGGARGLGASSAGEAANAGGAAVGDGGGVHGRDADSRQYDFDDADAAAGGGWETGDDLYSKGVARVAREEFILDRVSTMLSEDFVGDMILCSETMCAIVCCRRGYLFDRPVSKQRSTRGAKRQRTGSADVAAAELLPSRIERIRAELEGRAVEIGSTVEHRLLNLLAPDAVSALLVRTGCLPETAASASGAASVQEGETMSADTVRRWRDKWRERRTSWKHQNALLVQLLWSASTHSRSGVCFRYAGLLLGVSPSRCARAVSLCRQAQREGYFDVLDGIERNRVNVAALVPPQNRYAPSIVAAVSEFLHIYTRSSPTDGWRRCTTQEYNSVRALHKGARGQVVGAEALSLSAFQNMVHEMCTDEGSHGVKGENTDHNVW